MWSGTCRVSPFFIESGTPREDSSASEKQLHLEPDEPVRQVCDDVDGHPAHVEVLHRMGSRPSFIIGAGHRDAADGKSEEEH